MRSFKAIVVDDETDIREICTVSLRDVAGWEVECLSNGHELLHWDGAAVPDVILLDMMMPGLDGLGTIEQLRHHRRLAPVPVVLLTAKIRGCEMADYRGAGVAGVIGKPFDPMTLAKDIEQHLAAADSSVEARSFDTCSPPDQIPG